MYWYAVIIRNADPDCDPWVSVFDSEEKRGEFLDRVGKWIQDHQLSYVLTLETDSGMINSESYLSSLEDEYGD